MAGVDHVTDLGRCDVLDITSLLVERVYLGDVNVQSQHRYARAGELQRERKTDVAEAHNGNGCTHSINPDGQIDHVPGIIGVASKKDDLCIIELILN